MPNITNKSSLLEKSIAAISILALSVSYPFLVVLLFLVCPLKSVFYFCYLFLAIYFGFIFDFSNSNFDSSYYVDYYLSIARVGLEDFLSYYQSNIFTSNDTLDFGQQWIAFFISRIFPSEPRYYFIFSSFLYSFLQVIFINHVMKKFGLVYPFFFFLFLFLVVLMPIYNINGFRFWVAALLFMISLLYLSEKGQRKNFFIFCLLSIFFHFSFLFFALVLLFFSLTVRFVFSINFSRVYLYFISIVLSFSSYVVVAFVNLFVSDSALGKKVEYYFLADGVENSIFYKVASTSLFIYSCVALIFLSGRYFRIIALNSTLLSNFKLSFSLMFSCLFLMSFSSLARFAILFEVFFFVLLLQIYSNHKLLPGSRVVVSLILFASVPLIVMRLYKEFLFMQEVGFLKLFITWS